MVVDGRFSILTGSHSLKQVFYVSFVSKRVREEGGGRLFDIMVLGRGVYSGEGAYCSVGAYSRKCGLQNMTKRSRYISTTFIPNFNTRCK